MKKKQFVLAGLACLLGLALMFSAYVPSASAANPPVVRVMPDGIKTPTQYTAYAWAGNPVTLWGSVAWGDSASGTWYWDFDNNGTWDATGSVGDPRNISATYTYASAGTYYATLKVTDGNSLSSQATVRIDVLPIDDGQVSTNLAIESGLKYLYLSQGSGGDWSGEPAQTALSVLAFENRGHLPIGPDTDIYKAAVVNGINYLFTTLIWLPTGSYSYPGDPYNYDPDVHGYGGILGQYSPSCNDESFYPHGMIMMALAASGPYDKNYAKTDAVHNPALNLMVPSTVSNIGGWTYYQVLDDMMEFAAWAQVDPYYWGRGGWRYCPNSSDADNSVGQWPVIGLEAAEKWGIVAPQWVKDELKNYWLQYSYESTTYYGWGYDGASLIDDAHAGAGLSMLAYVGIPKTNQWYIDALNGLAAHWANQYYYTWDGSYWEWWPSHFGNTEAGTVYNYYAMYGIAKAMRIARDASGNVSPVTLIAGTIDWYSDYSTFLKTYQQSDGSWPGFWYWGTDTATPFSILILEPTVASLRPQASIVASPNPTNAGTTVNFNISGSTHQDPAKFLVSWKIIFDTSSGTNWATPDVSGSFPASAPIPKVGGYPQIGIDYNVTAALQVTDNVGETAEAIVVVQVQSGLVNPVANPGGPYFGAVGVAITLDGSGSFTTNPGGYIANYKWDLDGNGTYETDAGSSPTLPHIWAAPYTGQIGLQVTDNFGRIGTASNYANITVSDLKPVAYPLISYKRITKTVWEYTYKFEIKNQGNGPATNVSAALQNWPAQVTVVDGNVAFPDVNAGATVVSQDTFTIRMDRSVPVQNSDLSWVLTFTDAVHTQWTLVNFPLF